MLPASRQAAGGSLSQRDKTQIAQLCRLHTVRFAIKRLAEREFGWFLRSAHVLFQQKIDRIFADEDGTYRVYVVVYDRRAPDGFNPWSRHHLIKTNGYWKILRSY